MAAPRRPRLKVEECIDLNADQLRKWGALTPGSGSSVSTYWNDRLALVMRLKATQRWLFIADDSPTSPMRIENQSIELDSVGCNYGGRRTYFLCPGDECQRRCATLYLVKRCFRCRKCHGLLYASQTKDKWGRLLWQANKLREGLGGEPGTSQLIADRPRGMWKQTYHRKRMAIHEFERLAWEHLLESRGYGHLLVG
jgi:hypothetical protein